MKLDPRIDRVRPGDAPIAELVASGVHVEPVQRAVRESRRPAGPADVVRVPRAATAAVRAGRTASAPRVTARAGTTGRGVAATGPAGPPAPTADPTAPATTAAAPGTFGGGRCRFSLTGGGARGRRPEPSSDAACPCRRSTWDGAASRTTHGSERQAITTLDGGVRVFAGQRSDPFFVDLGSVFDLAGLRPFNALHLIPLPTADGVNGLRGLERAQPRAPGADHHVTRGRCPTEQRVRRALDDRCVGQRVAFSHHRARERRVARFRRAGAGVPPGQPPVQRGPRAHGPQGRVELPASQRGLALRAVRDLPGAAAAPAGALPGCLPAPGGVPAGTGGSGRDPAHGPPRRG